MAERIPPQPVEKWDDSIISYIPLGYLSQRDRTARDCLLDKSGLISDLHMILSKIQLNFRHFSDIVLPYHRF